MPNMSKISSYIADLGNSQWKAVAGNVVHSDKRPEHVTIAHALAEIPPTDYDLKTIAYSCKNRVVFGAFLLL